MRGGGRRNYTSVVPVVMVSPDNLLLKCTTIAGMRVTETSNARPVQSAERVDENVALFNKPEVFRESCSAEGGL